MSRHAFTLIEMIVVVFVLAAMAAIAAPNVASMIKASRVRSYLETVQRLPQEAAQQARASGRPVALTADEDGSFRLEQTDENAEATVLRTVASVPDLSPSRFRTQLDETSSGDWLIQFYPDGTSDRGGVEFAEGDVSWAFTVDGRSHGELTGGELEPIEEDRWPAGDYVRRS